MHPTRVAPTSTSTHAPDRFAPDRFAASAFVEPDVLIIDEALSVGDAYFQAKSAFKIRQLLDRGCTFLFVSHSAEAVKSR